jgi:ComF family protein
MAGSIPQPATILRGLEFRPSPDDLLSVAAAVLGHVLNFLYPPRCAVCGTRLGLGAGNRVCADCIERVERLPEPLCSTCGAPLESAVGTQSRCSRCLGSPPYFATARAIARYRPSAESERNSLPALIRRHKYGLDQSLEKALAEFLGDELPDTTADCDLVIPVPLHRSRLWWRGFNQAALLAAVVARRIGAPLEVSALARIRATTPQTSQNHDARRRNVRGAFAVRHPGRVTGRRVLLVDDVMTTGATADECARVLLKAGAARVDVLTLARVL